MNSDRNAADALLTAIADEFADQLIAIVDTRIAIFSDDDVDLHPWRVIILGYVAKAITAKVTPMLFAEIASYGFSRDDVIAQMAKNTGMDPGVVAKAFDQIERQHDHVKFR